MKSEEDLRSDRQRQSPVIVPFINNTATTSAEATP